MFFISRFNRLCKAAKLIEALSKGNKRGYFVSSCSLEPNQVKLKNEKTDDGTVASSPSDRKDDFIKIYRNKAVAFGAAVNKVKWYQMVVTVISVPASFALCEAGIIPPDAVVSVLFIGVWMTIFLYVQGILFYKMIGLISLSKDNKTVKIAYLDFGGNRVEKEYPLESVVQFGDQPEALTSRVIYRTIQFYTSAEKYRFYLFWGHILDKDRFVRVFGEV